MSPHDVASRRTQTVLLHEYIYILNDAATMQCSPMGRRHGVSQVHEGQYYIGGERGGVNDESAVDSIVEIEGWRLPRERRDVYDEEVKVGSGSDRAVGVQ